MMGEPGKLRTMALASLDLTPDAGSLRHLASFSLSFFISKMGLRSDYFTVIGGRLRQVGLSLCRRNPVPGPVLNYSATVRVRAGLGPWQTVSAPCAGDIVFSEFLPVLEPRKDCPGGPSHAFFLTEEHAGGEWFAHLQPGPPCSPPVCTPTTHNIAPIPVGQQAVPRGVD